LEIGTKTRFKKGITPWNKGKKDIYSEDTLKMMSNGRKGKKCQKNIKEK